LLAVLITDQPGSSTYFLGGIVAYADEVKRAQLGVPATLLTLHGAVSQEVALAMAEGVRSRLGTTLAASITGIAGPDAEGTKPVGLTYIAVATPRGASCNEYMFSGDRWSNRRQAAGQALRLLIEAARVNAGRLAS
jgi:PncC family amidohydrolase